MAASRPERVRWQFVVAGALAAVAAAYVPALGAGFGWDDHALIEDAPI